MRWLFLLFLLPLPAFSVGQAALPTLTLESHARYTAMGGAGGAVCFDAGAVHYNPAGLLFLSPETDIPAGGLFDYENLLPEFNFKDLYHRNISVYGRYRNVIAFAFTDKYISFGTNEWTDELGRRLGTFRSYDEFLILSIAAHLEEGSPRSPYSLGLNIKYLYSSLGDIAIGNEQRHAVAKSFAVDAGFLYREPFLNIFSAGITLQNMGPKIVYIDQNQADPLPFNLKLAFGATYDIPGIIKLTAALDLNK